ncbi:TrkA family potassium uptake protein [Helicobacter sp. 11S03491-1]|uniref:potassium channel family protein n=1 Tax=Helicobacter sp. 11S03491-1 TaxID=1476196 RepID=UPI000BA4FBDB|nr:TrkA family potassium uptake protein [Helicobacter sp. 11S03491-1]PAF41575.1 hypothetical protein BKH45_06650 [Helicobacter sp. 11S03491-1]
MKKIYAVIGLGKFGSYMAKGLVEQGENVIACDNTRENFRDLQEDIEDLYVLDSTDKSALQEAGISELDVVIVSIGENIEASILTVMALKELGNKFVVAKAVSKTHGQILSKIGADKVIYPEREAANHLLTEMINSRAEVTIISENLKMCKMIAGETFGKKTLKEIQDKNVEKNQKDNRYLSRIKIIALKHNDEWSMDIDPYFEISNDDFVVFIGDNEALDFYTKKSEIVQ